MSTDSIGRIRQAAEAEGYELAHAQESWGETAFGLAILVKMSERKLDRDKDSNVFYRVADEIRDALGTVSAHLDPEGPAQREQCRAQIEGIYRSAGVEAIYMEPLPNGYCPDPCCLNKPWFRVTSRIGHVVIGWRKSVISIDWNDSTVKESGEDLFPAEDVTRWGTGVHAWGVAKATEYIRRLHGPLHGPQVAVTTDREIARARVEAVVRDCVCAYLEINPESVLPETRFVDDLKCDELAAVEIAMDVEVRLSIEIHDYDVLQLATFKDAVEYATDCVLRQRGAR